MKKILSIISLLLLPITLHAGVACIGSGSSMNAGGTNRPNPAGDLTMAAWVRITSDTGTVNHIMAVGGEGSGNPYQGMGVETNASTDEFRGRCENTPIWPSANGPVLAIGTWYYVSLRSSTGGSDLTLRVEDVDYVLASCTVTDGGTYTIAQNFQGYGGVNKSIEVAFARVWEGRLSDAELETESGATAAQRTLNLWADYRFESGAITVDSSGNGYTLNNSGCSFVSDPDIGEPGVSLTILRKRGR